MTKRRDFLYWSGAAALSGLTGCASLTSNSGGRAQVLVVGGGFGGATAARYVRTLSGHSIDVTLVEPQSTFISCPMSNMVLGGAKTLADLTMPYDGLTTRHGVRLVRDRVVSFDFQKKFAVLASGAVIAYDKLVLSPGVDMMLDSVSGLAAAHEAGLALHAWKAGPETVALRKQLEAMPDGGVFAITVPEMPYRCPPAPYERACLVAEYLKAFKPKSKVLILDANRDVVVKGALFKKAWAEQYAGLVEHRPLQRLTAVDAGKRVLKIEGHGDVHADVMNVVPPMRSGQIAVQSGLATAGGRWCPVDYLTFESTVAKDVHLIGDAVVSPPGMPKSGHIANNQAKVAAAAIVAQLKGWEINQSPVLMNACYSMVSAKAAVHLANIYQYAPAEKSYKGVYPAPGGLSPVMSELEGVYAWDWARATWADTLG
jgi:sulfide dehydrogenase [flavocytochrome c] flavoprotein chain